MTVKRGYRISTMCKEGRIVFAIIYWLNLVAYPFVQGQLHSPSFKISQSQFEIRKEIDERSIFVGNQEFVVSYDK